MLLFDWDDANRDHLALHGISMAEAEHAMLHEPYEIEIQYHEGDSQRITYIGETDPGRILIVLITWRDELMRIITAWDAPKTPKKQYLARKAADHGIET